MRGALGLVVIVVASACSSGDAPADDRPARLQALLDDEVALHPAIPGAVLAVDAPGFTWTGAAGRFAPGEDRLLQPTDLFRVASVTKTFVAAATLVLVERGTLRLDAPLREVLRAPTLALLVDGGYDVDAITIRHLLGHTAGLFDYTETATFSDTIFDEPTHRWTREEQVSLAMTEGAPLAAPGVAYAYGDTAYVLLGEILEVATGGGLAEALRSLLPLDALGLADTWLETLEPGPSDGLARESHPLYGDVDTRGWDPSWDLYGGGGLVSSTADLDRFFEALFGGQIFSSPSTLATMLEVPAISVGAFSEIDGAMGIARFDNDGEPCYGGFGFFYTEVIHCPADGLTFARTINQAEPGYDDVVVTDAILAMFAR